MREYNERSHAHAAQRTHRVESLGKVETLGLVSAVPEENYVQIAGSTQFADGFPRADYEALVADMFAGKITVSNDIEKEPAVTAVSVDYQGNIK